MKNSIGSFTAKAAAFLLAFGLGSTAWGAADTSWYDAGQSSFTLTTEAQLRGLAQLVNAGNKFSGKTITLGEDIDVGSEEWVTIATNGDSTKFAGTFDGGNHTISNLFIDQSDETPAYRAAGFFGAINGTVKNLKFVNASVRGVSQGAATVNGIAVAVGSMAYGGTIDNVSVENATVVGNRYVAGIVGYAKGTVENCTIKNVSIVAEPDKLTGNYDNGDKAGGIVGYCNGAVTIKNNTIAGDFDIRGYRDIAGIVGCGGSGTTLVGNSVADDATVTVTIDQVTGNYGAKAANAGVLAGRVNGATGENGGAIDDSNSVSSSATTKTDTAVAVAQIGTVQYGTLEAATRAYQSGDTIEILGDASSMTAPEGWIINPGTPATLSVDPMSTWTKVADGFYQNAATYAASTDFYISSKEGLEYFRDLVNQVGTVADTYVSTFSTGTTAGWYQGNIFNGKTVHLMTDVDLGNVEWSPIGQPKNAAGDKRCFYGNFDGESHKVSNLKATTYTEATKTWYAGLFGNVAGTQTFSNLTIENVTLVGYDYAGAIIGNAGSNATAFNNCHVTGNINIKCTMVGAFVGGIVGIGTSAIDDCSVEGNTGSIIEGSTVGGLAGTSTRTAKENANTVTDSTVTGVTVKSDDNGGQAGGLVGKATNPVTVTGNTVHDVTVSAEAGKADVLVGGVGGDVTASSNTTDTNVTVISDPYADYVKVADGFYQNAATYAASTDFYITSKEGLEYFRDLVNQVGTVADTYVTTYVNASSTAASWYTENIFTGKTVHLMTDVDLENAEWSPIGQPTNTAGDKRAFYGNFDGGNHKISNLKATTYTEATKTWYPGLFGTVSGTQTFSDLTIENVTLVGYDYAGAVVGNAGSNATAFNNCHVTGAIDIKCMMTGAFVGGIVGIGTSAIDDCSVEGTAGSTIQGSTVGGLAGTSTRTAKENANTVTDSTVTGVTVKSDDNGGQAGGLVGKATNPVTVTGNTVHDVTVSAEAGTADVLVGGVGGDVTASSNTTDTNVTVISDPYAAYVKVADGFYQNAATYAASTDFYITNVNGLKYFRDLVNGDETVCAGYPELPRNRTVHAFSGKTVHLWADIDLNNEPWEPIGYACQTNERWQFEGSFDGGIYDELGNLTGTHKISNLNVSIASGKYYAGLFGVYNASANSTLKNLTLDGVTISSGQSAQGVGAFVGSAKNAQAGVTLENLHVIGNVSIVATTSYVGGIVGDGRCTIRNCSVATDGTIKGSYNVGGIAGGLLTRSTGMYGCAVTNATVQTSSYNYGLGALAGFSRALNVSNCTASAATVKCEVSSYAGQGMVGLLVGFADSTTAYTILSDNTVINTTATEYNTSVTTQVGALNNDYAIVGNNITYDESGKVTGGVFESIPSSAVADGYLVVDNSDAQSSSAYPLAIGGPYVAAIGSTGYATLAAAIAAADAAGVDEITILDGSTESPDVAWKVADGKLVRKVYVAQIGDVKYASLAEAILAAQDGNTIEILDGTWGADAVGTLTTSEALSVRAKSLTIQAASGASPKFTSNVTLGYDDSSTRNATMTVKGLAFENAQLLVGNYAQATVEDCKFSNATLRVIESCSSNYNRTDFVADQVTIKDCTFNGTPSGEPAIRVRNSGNLLITGNTVANSAHNGILLESNGTVNTQVAKTIVVTANEITEWNAGNVAEGGRGIRAALGTLAEGSTVTVEGNVFSKKQVGLDEPDFVKITGVGAGAVDISGNDWNDMLLSEVNGNSAIYSCDSASAPVIGSVITTKKEPVAQIGTTKYETLAEALKAANSGDTVQLLEDVDMTDYFTTPSTRFPISKSLTIDGQNHTITVGRRGFGVGMNAGSKIDVTFKDVTINNSSADARCIDTRGNLNSLTLDHVTLDTNGGSGTTQPLTIGGNQADKATVNIVNGSKIQTNDEGTAYYAIITFNPVNMTIDDSTIKGWACIYAKGPNSSAGSAGSVFTITDSELVSKNVYSGTSNAFAMLMAEADNVTFNVTNTKIDVNATGDQHQAIVATGSSSQATGVAANLGEGNEVTLSGEATFESNKGSAVVSGGTFNVAVPEEACAEGYIPAAQDPNTGLYTVKEGTYVAQIGDVKYASLAEAFEAAQSGDTVKLLTDCETGTAYTHATPLVFNTANATLDLNGKTLTITYNMSLVFRCNSGVVMNGSIVPGVTDSSVSGDWCRYGLTIDSCSGVTVSNVVSTTGIAVGGDPDGGYTPGAGPATDVVFTGCTVTGRTTRYAVMAQNQSTATIKDGTYNAYAANGNVLYSGFKPNDGGAGSLTVTGGSFMGAIPDSNVGAIVISGGIFSKQPVAGLLAPGYVVVANEDAATKDAYPYTVTGPVVAGFSASDMEASSETEAGGIVTVANGVVSTALSGVSDIRFIRAYSADGFVTLRTSDASNTFALPAGFGTVTKVVAYCGENVTATAGAVPSLFPRVDRAAEEPCAAGSFAVKSGVYYSLEVNGVRTALHDNKPVAPAEDGDSLKYSVPVSPDPWGVVKFRIIVSDEPLPAGE